MPRVYSTTCVDCGDDMTLPYRPPAGGMSCGTGACLSAHNARSNTAQRAGRIKAAETRRENVERVARPIGDPAGWSAVAKLVTRKVTNK